MQGLCADVLGHQSFEASINLRNDLHIQPDQAAHLISGDRYGGVVGHKRMCEDQIMIRAHYLELSKI